MTTTLAEAGTGRSLVSDDLFDRLARRIVADENLSRELAERILDQALAFLAACARNAGEPLAPSELVDIGWHTFILHTRDYAEFCQRIAGRFLHHVPTEELDGLRAHETLTRTVEAIRRIGFRADETLWPRSDTAGCTGCQNGCHDDPPPASRP